MLKDKGPEAFMIAMWDVYIKWPCDPKPVQTVMRYNRKEMLAGRKVDSAKNTWPLHWESADGEESIQTLMGKCGWTELQIQSLREQLFGLKEESGVHPNCVEEEVTWPDLQQVFRSVVSEDPWSAADNEVWPGEI